MIKPATVIPHKAAKKLAERYSPVFVQYYLDNRDQIAPVHFGSLTSVAYPTIYFSAKQDETHYYILYCVYHRKDWSSRGGLIGKLDSHNHDLEGALIVVDRTYGGIVQAASIFHNEIRFYSHLLRFRKSVIFSIQAEGHGIFMESFINEMQNQIWYMRYDLENLNEERVNKLFFGRWKEEFNKNGVSTPDQWGYVSKMGVKSKGLIYTDPLRLFNMARKRKLLE